MTLEQIAEQVKVCSKCKTEKPISEFHKNKNYKSGIEYFCCYCQNKYTREYRKANPDKAKTWNKNSSPAKKVYYRAHREERLQHIREYEKVVKVEVLTKYSNASFPACTHCGINDVDVLTIDHINGGGAAHKKVIGSLGGNLYSWLKQNNFPEGYQVLCFNCNFKKALEDRREARRH